MNVSTLIPPVQSDWVPRLVNLFERKCEAT